MYFLKIAFLMLTTFNINTIVFYDKYSTLKCKLVVSGKCNENNLQYFIFTKNSSYQMDLQRFKKMFLPSKPTKIIIHGYGGMKPINGIIVEYLKQNEDYNIIAINWENLAKIPCYPVAVINMKYVGQCASEFIGKLVMAGLDLKLVHIVGFSLGAHVAGFLSNFLVDNFKLKVNRITGLDPALPLIDGIGNGWKLTAKDAHFVDIIHTNSGIYGKIEPTGHVDFYFNNGRVQNSCNNDTSNIFCKQFPLFFLITKRKKKEDLNLCSHFMSTTYFAESINTKTGFWGKKCFSYMHAITDLCKNVYLAAGSDQILMGHLCDTKLFTLQIVKKRNNLKECFLGLAEFIMSKLICYHHMRWEEHNFQCKQC